jgi:fumarylacetoacetase
MVQAARWLPLPPAHPFGLAALPYGSYTSAQHADAYRVGVAIGDHVLDLTTATERLLPTQAHLFRAGSLDNFLAAGDLAWAHVRDSLSAWLSDDACRSALEDLLVSAAAVSLRVPFAVADFVDFYASENHAANAGRMFRPGADPLPANWKHQPIGYHSRAGSVVVSGTGIRRPHGQSRPPGADAPWFGPSARLDFEAELGFVVGARSHLGEPVPVSRFAQHVFGVCLVNDWSARDIQSFESVPLGPFLGKSFATTVSPWVLPLAALQHARVRPPSADARLQDYLTETADWGQDIDFRDLAAAVRLHVLEAGADAGPPDRERRGLALRRSVCVGNCERSRAWSARIPHRARLERRHTGPPSGRDLALVAPGRRRGNDHGFRPRPRGRQDRARIG